MDREIPKKEIKRRRLKKLLKLGCLVAANIAVVFVASIMMRKSVKESAISICTVDRGTIESTVSASGKVAPAFEEIITSPIASRIVEVYSKAGDSVASGTPLLRLDLHSTETALNKLLDEIEMKRHMLEQQRLNNATSVSDLEMQIKVKAMTVDRMAVELRNEQYLDSLGSGTGDKVRQVELAYRTGLLELEQMRQKLANERRVADADMKVKNLELNISDKNLSEMRRTLEDARIRAPRTATLTYINDQIGQKVAEGEKIAIVSDLTHFKIEAEASDAYSDRLRVGSKAIVKIGSEKLTGVISNVTPLSSNGVISFSVRLDDDSNKRLRSGLKTEVYVLCDVIEDVVRIANGSYFTGPGRYDIFVLDGDNNLVRRKVQLGQSNFEFVEVISGLSPGDRAVTSDMKDYRNNEKIRLKK
ncbi:MAG: HlyD family efflux transporter periplasmic adaptor subunit [Muribaculaceae bacterium]|nr:HlyD family efflux transporter periplasmic adaptor subunit [Muribaculaceae bacterium]